MRPLSCHNHRAKEIAQKVDAVGSLPFPLILAQRSDGREQDLAKALQEIYDEEMEYHNGVVAMADAVKATLKAVQDELGPPGIIDPNNVPDAESCWVNMLPHSQNLRHGANPFQRNYRK